MKVFQLRLEIGSLGVEFLQHGYFGVFSIDGSFFNLLLLDFFIYTVLFSFRYAYFGKLFSKLNLNGKEEHIHVSF